jgi:exonuclease SbcC
MAARDRVAEALTEAERQIPMARELDRRLTQGQEFLELVELVRTKLAPGAFIGHLINLRQQALLGVASTMLSEITNGRYGFSSDFDIFDQLSGQPRSPRTLSGGETFLASLALALAMVELAARAGGRLDALFLDEGFGALDLDNLEAAVDALEARAQSGRLVVVITHVMAVAERISAVLAVYDQANSSHVAWLDDTQRQIAANTEVEAELSKTLTRLLR